MSSFEYYEFMTVDKPLSPQQMDEIRNLSSRVKLSSNRAIFIYNYGSFKGDVKDVLSKYFDAFIYISNFGTKEVRFRIPSRFLKKEALCPYEVKYATEIDTIKDTSIISFLFDDETSSGWIDEEDCTDLLEDLIPIREDLLQGDPRPLFLTLVANEDNLSDELVLEALPVPPNLKKLSPALETLCHFFEISDDQLNQYANLSSDSIQKSIDISVLNDREKDIYLQQILDRDPHVRINLLQRLEEKM